MVKKKVNKSSTYCCHCEAEKGHKKNCELLSKTNIQEIKVWKFKDNLTKKQLKPGRIIKTMKKRCKTRQSTQKQVKSTQKKINLNKFFPPKPQEKEGWKAKKDWRLKLTDMIEDEIVLTTGIKSKVHKSGECLMNDIIYLVENKIAEAKKETKAKTIKEVEDYIPMCCFIDYQKVSKLLKKLSEIKK